jgi:NodT family efflux transporter outer membrane factor (OMF) lipoprotein
MKTVLSALAVATLSACASFTQGPDYHLPPQAVANQQGAAAPFAGAEAAPYSAAPLPAHWWQLYQDARLDALINEALVRNTDLRAATANLERVQAIEAEVAGGRKPSIAFNANPYYGHPSGVSLLQSNYVPPDKYRYSASLGISYDLDIFGKLKRGIEATTDDSEAAQAALDLARVNVAAGTARAYAEVCSTGLRLDSANKSVSLQQEAVELSERLQQAGRVSTIDAARARSQLDALKAALPSLLAERQGALYRLATLTGRLPQDFPREVADCNVPPQLTQTIPVGDGAALLRRRPDIREAERTLAAATARIGYNMADRYPKISLGLSGSSGSTAVDFGRSDSLGWSLGPLISWTLPNTGAVDARIEQARAGTRAALAKFDGTVLTALRETETALSTYAQELDRRTALRASRDAAAEVSQQSRRLYQSGKVDYLQALDADRALASAEAALASSEAALADDQVQLFLALGGGWEQPDKLSPKAQETSLKPAS